ncbi:MAG TPA: hypothetical protein VJT82_02375, partial [Pyrinomonadaceae bacterium]|nr:hypothetical protein [Pyrinomonadaceae bacterium]
MRRKLGIAILGIIMALAGTQEAVQQFRGLKSSVTDWTRDSLWSGLIVYAQPVTDSSLPTPQLYYMMPQVAPCPPEPSAPMLADNVTDAVKPETKNSHAVQTANATATEAGAVEETAKTEFVLDKLPPSVVASTFDALPAELPRAFVEVAKNETFKMKLAKDVNALEAAQKDFDVERLEADAARLANDRAKFEALKMRAVVDAEKFNRRVEIKIMRRPERVRVPAPPMVERRALVLLPEISSS